MATTSTSTSRGLGTRLRQSLTLAQDRIQIVEDRTKARWIELPASLRSALASGLSRARERIRDSLELPSRAELASLVERIENIDSKLTELERARAAAARQEAPEQATGKKAEAKKAATKKTAGKKTASAKKTAGKKTAGKKTASAKKTAGATTRRKTAKASTAAKTAKAARSAEGSKASQSKAKRKKRGDAEAAVAQAGAPAEGGQAAEQGSEVES